MTGIEEAPGAVAILSAVAVSISRRGRARGFCFVCRGTCSRRSPTLPPPAAVALTPQDNADLQRIAAYLNSIRTMYARFQQVAVGRRYRHRAAVDGATRPDAL